MIDSTKNLMDKAKPTKKPGGALISRPQIFILSVISSDISRDIVPFWTTGTASKDMVLTTWFRAVPQWCAYEIENDTETR